MTLEQRIASASNYVRKVTKAIHTISPKKLYTQKKLNELTKGCK